jgi:hypothetical protein
MCVYKLSFPQRSGIKLKSERGKISSYLAIRMGDQLSKM